MVAIDGAINPHVKAGVAYWRSLCGERRFPARSELTLRGAAAILRYSVIVGVIEGGADFEFRYVGDDQRRAFKTYFKGMRVTQIEAVAPELGAMLRTAYEHVRASGVPFVARGRVDHEPPGSQFLHHESAFLPLGATDSAVDHLLIVGVQIPEPFWEFSPDQLKTLTDQVIAPIAEEPRRVWTLRSALEGMP